MDTGTVLLAALHARPDDDSARLALADWLEEQGESERAELTRLHALLRHEPEGPRRWLWEERVWALLRAGVKPYPAEVVNSIGMRFSLIPSGSFWMGSPAEERERARDEGPRHPVIISRPFYLGVFPVTQSEFQKVMGFNPSYFVPSAGLDLPADQDTSSFPVDGPNWFEATEFCDRLSALPAERAQARIYRLPTEAEWEYACRAGVSSRAATYLGPALHSSQANFDGNYPYLTPPGPCLNRTSVVGSYLPNAYGLYDMLGNVGEWCRDRYGSTYYTPSPVRDPQGPAEGTLRVLRGAGWYFSGRLCRSARRGRDNPDRRSYFAGFRVLLVWTPQAPR